MNDQYAYLDAPWLPPLAIGIGIAVVVLFIWIVRKPGNWNTTPAPILPADRGQWPLLITRWYHGNRTTAQLAFSAEYARYAPYGYVPIAQLYVEGSWACGAFALAAFAILFFGLGLLVLLYLLVVKPDGTLTVTYQLQAPPQPASPAFQRF